MTFGFNSVSMIVICTKGGNIMFEIHGIDLNQANREERLPGFQADFPYIATRAQLNRYANPHVPWHWHRAVELFYIECGTLEYTTPKGQWLFAAGSGGLVNSNVLHTTRPLHPNVETTQLLHIFDPGFLGGSPGSRIDSRYILPLTANPALEVIPLDPNLPEQAAILERIRDAFALDPAEIGYELRLRHLLAEAWLALLHLSAQETALPHSGTDDQIKTLLIYIHEHYSEPISVDALASTVHISKRVCFRLFQEQLHTTPVAYIRSLRLQKACNMLVETDVPIARIGEACGLGSPSYFGKTFREHFGLSPVQYRQKWHDRDRICLK